MTSVAFRADSDGRDLLVSESNASRSGESVGARQELAEVVDALNSCIAKADAMGRTLLVAYLDQALTEAKRAEDS